MSSRSQLWCDSCESNRDTQTLDDGRVCCGFCGKILVEDNYLDEVIFAKDGGGQKLNSKINYDALDDFSDDSFSPDNKKSHLNDEVYATGTEYMKPNIKQNDSEQGPENEDDGGPEEFSEGLPYGNEEDYLDDYDYDDDY
ncbi:hypothetical protein ACET3Z_029602 [Daucus carota]